MPSHQFIHMKNGNVRMHGRRVGGAVLLLKQELKPPIRGGEISTSNKFVGIITPQPAKPVIEGGQLLKNIHFGSHSKKPEGERIKFIF